MENKIISSSDSLQEYLHKNIVLKQDVLDLCARINNHSARLEQLTEKINNLVDYGRALLKNNASRYENN